MKSNPQLRRNEKPLPLRTMAGMFANFVSVRVPVDGRALAGFSAPVPVFPVLAVQVDGQALVGLFPASDQV
jgi:hypothetical protein